MIDISKLNDSFRQRYNSCVLASYAIVGNYFTNIPINQFFEDYCNYFKESFGLSADAENKYTYHFDKEWKKRNCSGYKIILELHSNSNEPSFKQSREIFTGEYYPDSSNHIAYFEDHLLAEESFLNITFRVPGGCHSVTVFNYRKVLCLRDTATNNKLVQIKGWASLGTMVDSVLYKRINKVKRDGAI